MSLVNNNKWHSWYLIIWLTCLLHRISSCRSRVDAVWGCFGAPRSVRQRYQRSWSRDPRLLHIWEAVSNYDAVKCVIRWIFFRVDKTPNPSDHSTRGKCEDVIEYEWAKHDDRPQTADGSSSVDCTNLLFLTLQLGPTHHQTSGWIIYVPCPS